MRKGQVWYIDMIIGVLIFVGALVYFFESDINFLQRDEDILTDLNLEAKLVTTALMGGGYPEGWDPSTVQETGIMDQGRVNMTKLGYLGSIGYNESKGKLRTKYDYYLFFEDSGGPISINGTHEGIGKPGANSTNIMSGSDPSHLIKMVRFVAYDSDPARMVLYLWR